MPIYIYHVDVEFPPDESCPDGHWNRWIFCSLYDVVGLIETNKHFKFKISRQIRRCDTINKKYKVVDIDIVYKNTNAEAVNKYIVYCDNGKFYSELSEINSKDIVYY